MPWPYLFFNFVAFTLLYSGHVVAGITTLVTEAAFFVLDARRAGRKLLFPVLLGLLLGFSLFILRLPYLSLTNHNFESGEAVVTAVSRKSVVIARVDKIKLRLIGIPKEKLPPKYARIVYTCKEQPVRASTFRTLERISGVRAWCKVTTLDIQHVPSSVWSRWRAATFHFLNARFDTIMQKNKSLVAAFLLGDTEDLSASELEAFRSMGLMHLFAVSGLNIALLFALLYIPFRLIGQKAIGTALGYTVAVLFLLLLDFPVPLLRAWVFMTIALFMRVLDRRIPSWTSLFLTAIFVEILFPLSTFSMSFILSFGVTAAIFIFYEPFYFCFASSKKYLKLWNEHLALTLAAGLPALLLTYFLFGQANPLSLLYNLLLVPFSGIYLFAALIFLFFDPAQYIFLPLDTLYLEFAEWHQTYISANFPLADKTAQQISLAFVATLLLLLYITKIRRRLWSAKRFVRVVIPLLVVILLLPYFLVEYPKNAFYAIPNKVWIYSDAQLTTVGASVFSPPPKEPKICFPVHHRHEIALDKRMPKEILQHGNACYIFSGRMQPEKWRSHILKPCSQLYLLHGKDVTPNVAEWKSLFVLFGYSGAVALRNYFKWYGDGIVDCM